MNFTVAMAEGGWLGITMPEELGGSGLGVTEAALMMNAVAKGGGGAAAMSTLQINLFAPHPHRRPWDPGAEGTHAGAPYQWI